MRERLHSIYLYVFTAVVVLFVRWYECRMSVFSPFSRPSPPPPPPPPSLSFWGSGHRLVLIFLGSFMFIPTVTACSFCFCFLAVDVVDICMKRTGMSASLHSLPPPPQPPPPVHTQSFLSDSICVHSLHSLSSGLGTHGPCVSLCCLTLASLLTALFSVDITAKHLLLFSCIVIQCGLFCQSLIVDEKEFWPPLHTVL